MYLTGRLDGDDLKDYAVAVLEKATGSARILVCTGDGKEILLGEAGKPQFSDMEGDNYMSSTWRICSRSAVRTMQKYYKDVPITRSDSLCLTWEDGEALIYWDADRFRWKSFNP
jgi:hypothetical protein